MHSEVSVATKTLRLKILREKSIKIFHLTIHDDGTITIQSDDKVQVVEKSPANYWIRIQ